MLIVRPIGPGAGRYYAASPEPGTWLGGGAAALGLSGQVDVRDLGAVLGGRYPAGPETAGHPAARRPAARPEPLGDPRHPRRRAGWDLTFAAPKGVSLVTALVEDTLGVDLVGAHRAAVDEAMAFSARHACWVNRDNGYQAAGEGLVAAQFHHATSAAGDPHLHTHVLLVNALRGEDGKWSAVASSPFWRSEREVEAIYRLALRHYVGLAGHQPRWAITADGGADLADVPRPAVVAASRRRIEMAAHRRAGREATGASAARAVTRSQVVARTGDLEPWRAAVARAGLGTRHATELLGAGETAPAGGAAAPGEAADAGLVSEALAAKASSFTVRDVIRALAATSVPGMTAAAAERRAERFCAAAIPKSSGRWTTERSMAADATLVDRVTARLGAGVGIVDPRRVEAATADRSLDGAGRSAVRHLLAGGRGVDVLAGEIGRDRLDAQATVLDVARRAWQASAFQVAVVQGGRRWEALAGLPDERRLPAGERAQILVVDRADRLPTAELGLLLDDAAEREAKVILVEGGTLPRRARPLSDGLVTIGDKLGRLGPGRVDPSPAPESTPMIDPGGRVVVGSGRDALAYLIDLWQGAAPGRRPLLVGAGPPEVAMLNDAVRTRLVDSGMIGGQAMQAGGRSFQVGDRVLALRSNQGAAIPAASLGTVTEVERGGRAMSVAWDRGAANGRAGRTRIERGHAGFVGYGWATTPALAATAGLEAAVLGAPSRAGPDPGRVKASTLIAAVAARAPQRHPTLDAAVLEAGVAGSTADLRGRSGPDLAAEHHRLSALLAAGLPDHRGRERLRWLADHRPSLGRWDALGQALEDRADLLAHAAAGWVTDPVREPHHDPRPARGRGEPAYELGLG